MAASNAGRKPAPPVLKLLGGRSPGRDSGGRKVAPPPPFVRAAPTPPTWLSTEAKAEWRRIVPSLDRMRLLKPESRSSLSAYCECWSMFVMATRQIAKDGLTIDAKQGMLPHPAVGIQRAAARELRAWCAEFGLTPSAEGRLTIPEAFDDGEESLLD